MLQLLLEGGESYDDLAALLDVPVEEARQRAAAALQALGGAFQGSRQLLVDYLLGQAAPEAAGYAEGHLTENADDLATARRLIAKLRLLFPGAMLPNLPEPVAAAGADAEAATHEPDAAPTPAPEATLEPAPEAEATPEPKPEAAPAAPAPAAGRPTLSRQQKRLLALLSAVALVVVIVVLAVSGAFDGNEAAKGEQTTASTTAAGETVQGDESMLTRAVLRPQDGGKARGLAIFGAVDEQTPVLQVAAENLAATKKGDEYSVWLYNNDKVALRLAGVEVGANGQLATQIELPAEALNFIVDGTLKEIDISLNAKSAYRREMRASEREQRLPRRIGKSILRGPITGPGLASTQTGN